LSDLNAGLILRGNPGALVFSVFAMGCSVLKILCFGALVLWCFGALVLWCFCAFVHVVKCGGFDG
jgi:hypothetical protein